MRDDKRGLWRMIRVRRGWRDPYREIQAGRCSSLAKGRSGRDRISWWAAGVDGNKECSGVGDLRGKLLLLLLMVAIDCGH